MPWGAVIGGVIAGAGSIIGSQTQADAASNAQAIQQQEFNTITQQETPYMQGGYGALSALEYGLGINPSGGGGGYDPSSGYVLDGSGGIGRGIPSINGSMSPGLVNRSNGQGGTSSGQGTGLGFGSLLTPFTADNWKQLSPAYNFQLQQGQQGVLNQDSGALGAESGAALKDLISYNQNAANSSFNNAFQMYQAQQGNIYNRLAGIAQLGQTSAANTGQQGTALAGNMGSAAVAAGNAIGTGISSAANAAGNAANTYAYLNALNNSGSSFQMDPSVTGAAGADSGYSALVSGLGGG